MLCHYDSEGTLSHTNKGVLKLKHKAMADDIRPIDATCTCMVCKKYTRAYIHSLVTKDAMGSQLLSYHNLSYMLRLSGDLHKSIVEERFPGFVREFLKKMFPNKDVPEWVCNAMEVAGVDIAECCDVPEWVCKGKQVSKDDITMNVTGGGIVECSDIPKGACNAKQVPNDDIADCCS